MQQRLTRSSGIDRDIDEDLNDCMGVALPVGSQRVETARDIPQDSRGDRCGRMDGHLAMTEHCVGGGAPRSAVPVHKRMGALELGVCDSYLDESGEVIAVDERFKVSQGRGISSCWVATWFAPRGPAKIL